jgi:hypothetical protein
MQSLSVRLLRSAELSPDGSSVSIVTLMQDGSEARFSIPTRNAEFLAKGVIKLTREASARRERNGKADTISSAFDTLVVTGHRVATKSQLPHALVQMIGHWISSEEALGAITLALDAKRVELLGKELSELARALPRSFQPS